MIEIRFLAVRTHNCFKKKHRCLHGFFISLHDGEIYEFDTSIAIL